MSGVLIKAEQVSQQLIERGKAIQTLGEEVRRMIADGVVDDEELSRLFRVADEAEDLGWQVEDTALDVQDVAADILDAKQTLTIGRNATPNQHLREHCREIDRRLAERDARRQSAEGEQKKSSSTVEIEEHGTLGKLAA